VREVVTAVEGVTGRPVPLTTGPRRPGDPPMLVAQPDRAREALGFSAAWTELEPIVESVARWRRDHPRGYEEAR
jgi:UDP-glucose 4-epimerase